MIPLDARTSRTMSRVRSTGTTPETRVGQALRAIGLRYRKHVRALPGTPDFANRTQGWAVLVHGCFWHRHGCKRTTTPVHNAEHWAAKFARNQARDARVEAALAAAGLKVITIWECETRDAAALQARLAGELARTPPRSDMGGR
ncbi:very short patch repair endonuclease [Brevundimonas sp.]|jgi:DNA mismatch endonuclease (patch repair protein)|uniref:very short patch repair endonuclease n=1 Tax=Brevundimonas sp. TaxID=1871086 RepID=UPI002E114C88|nr:very short patch repair endonuclease [Brevundimonas sp.]